jgi:hypothetical protein
MSKIKFHGVIKIPPLGENKNLAFDTWIKEGIPWEVHQAILDLGDDTDFMAFGKKLASYWRIQEAINNLFAGEVDAVLKFFRLILNLKGGAASKNAFEAFWRMSIQPAWRKRGIKNILAYVAKTIILQERRLRNQRHMEDSYPKEWDGLVEEYGEKGDMRDLKVNGRDTPAYIDPYQAAVENIDFIRKKSTKRQRQIVDLLLRSPIKGDPMLFVSKNLKISRDNIRKQIDLLNKKLHI